VAAMNGDQQYPIGEVARRTGLSVKAIRYYADTGVVTPSGRTPAGYRLFSGADVARLDPTSPECDDLVATVMGEYATAVGRPDGPALRTELAAALDRANDPRWQRYLELVSVINGWPHDSSRPVLDWFGRALAARQRRGDAHI
jgi:hypothetical protein